MEDLIYMFVAAVLTYFIGLVQNKPGYKKGKNIQKTLHDALADDVLTQEEIEQIYMQIKGFIEKK